MKNILSYNVTLTVIYIKMHYPKISLNSFSLLSWLFVLQLSVFECWKSLEVIKQHVWHAIS